MASRIPHHLEPYLVLSDPATLIALTSVLGASTNWLITRYLHALLTTPSPQHASHSSPSSPSPYPRNDGPPPQQQQPPAVLLISFLRSLPFWKDSLSRLGTDLETAARRGRFAYVDGLGCELFSPSSSASSPSPRQHQQQQAWQQGWQGTLPSASPEDIKRIVLQGVELLRRGSSSTGAAGGEGRRVILVVDGLDFVLAASPGGSGTALAMKEVLMELREKTHAAIITLAADDPLIKEQETALEKQHAWFALSLAHEADTVLSLRLLDTGAAKDVSGVIRITHGGSGGARGTDHEYLYHVGGDGGVKVFERGQ